MATQTTRLGLMKPEYTDAADIAVINANMDKLDALALHVYPVGSIYMSVVDTSPATLFGGTWERLKDRFLLGAGDTYSAGATGGAASVSYTPGGTVGDHTLTTTEIPSHNHSFTGSAVTSGDISANHTHTGTSGNQSANHTHTGPSHAHNVSASTYNRAIKPPDNSSYSGWYAGFGQIVTDPGGSSAVPGFALYADRTGLGADLEFSVDSGNAGTGATGGTSADHTHTTTTGNQSAGHTHSVTAAGSIGNTGGGVAHNHGFTGTAATIDTMPPYLAVYMWKRTA